MTSSTHNSICLACGTAEHRHLSIYDRGQIYSLLECSECGLVHVEKPSTTFTTGPDSCPNLDTFSRLLQWLNNQLILKPEVRRFRQYLRGKGPLLDIGCGTGGAAAFWRDRTGVDAHGLEIQPKRAEMAAIRHGLHILRGRIEEVSIPDQTYQFITLRHVLEHFINPYKVLQKVHRILKPNGYVLIVVPNCGGLGRRIFGPYWIWDPSCHLFAFSPSPLKRLLDRAGFETKEVIHSPSPVLISSSVNNWLVSTGRSRLARWFRSGNIFLNGLLFPLSVIGKLMQKSEVITVLAQKRTGGE